MQRACGCAITCVLGQFSFLIWSDSWGPASVPGLCPPAAGSLQMAIGDYLMAL